MFTYLVFIVKRKVYDKVKARVVTNLRDLNSLAVPDSYPLPLITEVIDSLRGKKYITVIDTIAFFY